MNITVATLCDFAQTRNGLLFVSSGCISRMYRARYPAPMNMMLALSVEVAEHETSEPFGVTIRVEDADGTAIAEQQARVGVRVKPADPGDVNQIPIPIDLRAVPIPRPGRFMVRAFLPDFPGVGAALSFVAAPPRGPRRREA